MINVGHILQEKGNRIWSVSPAAMAYDALALMAENNLDAILVMGEAGIVGIFSEQDYARKMIGGGRPSGGLMSGNAFHDVAVVPDPYILPG